MRPRKFIALCICFFIPFAAIAGSKWKRADAGKITLPAHSSIRKNYLAYTADEDGLKSQLFQLTTDPAQGQVVELPMPDGTTRNFKVWHSPMMPDALAAKYPSLKTFTGVAVDNPNITAKLDFTSYGFHAIVFDGINISMIDPAGNNQPGYYTVHYKKDETREPEDMMQCGVTQEAKFHPDENMDVTRKVALRTSNGYQLRTYRLALSCDHFYASAVTGVTDPTIAQVLSKMITSMNRINGVYEREFAITMNFIANEDTLIFNTASGGVNGADPFASIDNDAYNCLLTNQTVCDTRIGNANYDIGHVFTTGAGGLSEIGVVCMPDEPGNPSLKAESVTGQPQPWGDGFDIDYVAHEMGHEYGADHPFNDAINGSCNSNTIYPPTAYEPGSGSTIMAYAGICSPDDLQPHSDAYFNSVSLLEIQNYITGAGDVCAVHTPTNNKLVSLPPFTTSYTIPYLTPFELTAPAAADSVADTSITYCWEQYNLGDVGQELVNTHQSGPIFRSFSPTTSPTRVFPNMTMVLADSLSNAGTEDAQGEKVPDVARFLTFRLTMRDIFQGTGCFLVPDDTVHLDVINTGMGFAVTSQNTSGNSYLGYTPLDITWNVAGTDAAPINTPNVDIYMSGDGGYTWPYHIGTFINNGSASIILPNPDTSITAARFKVKGSGNVFFNVNKDNFSVEHNSSTIAPTAIEVYPSPVNTTLRLYSGDKGILQFVVYNSIGQKVMNGEVNGELDVPVNDWARGLYIIKFIDAKNQRTIKKFVVD